MSDHESEFLFNIDNISSAEGTSNTENIMNTDDVSNTKDSELEKDKSDKPVKSEDKKDDDNVIALKLSDKNMKYYQFSYNQPQDFTIVADKSKKYQTANPADLTEQAGGSALNNTGNGGSVVNQVFKNNSVTAQITKSDDSYKYYFLQVQVI